MSGLGIKQASTDNGLLGLLQRRFDFLAVFLETVRSNRRLGEVHDMRPIEIGLFDVPDSDRPAFLRRAARTSIAVKTMA